MQRPTIKETTFLHKLSRLYVSYYDNICVEYIDVKGLKEKGHNRGVLQRFSNAINI
jgi:putative transposase